jgi:hypothetical protein
MVLMRPLGDVVNALGDVLNARLRVLHLLNMRMAGTRRWESADLTSGPFTAIVPVTEPQYRMPGSSDSSAGDDSVYSLMRSGVEVQVDPCPKGNSRSSSRPTLPSEAGTLEAAAIGA